MRRRRQRGSVAAHALKGKLSCAVCALHCCNCRWTRQEAAQRATGHRCVVQARGLGGASSVCSGSPRDLPSDAAGSGCRLQRRWGSAAHAATCRRLPSPPLTVAAAAGFAPSCCRMSGKRKQEWGGGRGGGGGGGGSNKRKYIGKQVSSAEREWAGRARPAAAAPRACSRPSAMAASRLPACAGPPRSPPASHPARRAAPHPPVAGPRRQQGGHVAGHARHPHQLRLF